MAHVLLLAEFGCGDRMWVKVEHKLRAPHNSDQHTVRTLRGIRFTNYSLIARIAELLKIFYARIVNTDWTYRRSLAVIPERFVNNKFRNRFMNYVIPSFAKNFLCR